MIVYSGGTPTIRFLWRDSIHRASTPEHALQFLERFKNDAVAMAGLRRLLGEREWLCDASRMTDDHVLATVARLMSAGELLAGLEWKSRVSAPRSEEAVAPVPAGAQPQSRPEEEPEGETFAGDHDGATQAGALRAAAESGVPFCEECARAAAAGGAAR